ncbi:MAG: glycosyltransferase [Vicinamibacterales bacterium]
MSVARSAIRPATLIARRIRVAFLLPTCDVSGAERVVLRTAMAMDPARFEPIVVAIVRGRGNLARELDEAGVPVVILDEGTRPRIRQLGRLYRWLRSHPQDVLITYMFHANIAGRLMRRTGAVPRVVSSERSAGLDARWRVLVDRGTTRWADAITVNSVQGRGFWSAELGLPENRITLIYNGLDTTAYSPGAPATQPRIGVLARLRECNGQDWFLDALALLDSMCAEPWTCVFAGAGPTEPALRRKIDRLGIGHRVEFVGHVSDPIAFLRTLMVSVHPALFSGMPNAVIEAMACGLPVVATAVGGTPEAIDDGDSGWLVRPGDVVGTASRLAELLRSPDLRARAGAAARAKAERQFSSSTMVMDTEALIARLFAAAVERAAL